MGRVGDGGGTTLDVYWGRLHVSTAVVLGAVLVVGRTTVRGSIGGFASGSDNGGRRRGDERRRLWWSTYEEGERGCSMSMLEPEWLASNKWCSVSSKSRLTIFSNEPALSADRVLELMHR